MEKHVGKRVPDLQRRLETEPNLRVASSFHDERIADHIVQKTLEREDAKITAWLKDPDGLPLRLEYRGTSSIGTLLHRGQTAPIQGTNAVLILKPSTEGGFYVLTAYVE